MIYISDRYCWCASEDCLAKGRGGIFSGANRSDPSKWRDAQGLEIAGVNMCKLQANLHRHSVPVLGGAGGMIRFSKLVIVTMVIASASWDITPAIRFENHLVGTQLWICFEWLESHPDLCPRKFRPMPVWHERLHVSSEETWLQHHLSALAFFLLC